MKYCRVDLSKTNYKPLPFGHLILNIEKDDKMDLIQQLYRKYCTHKQFESVVPLFEGMIFDRYTDVMCYYPDNKLAAFSVIKRYDRENAEALQFAWDYNNPELRLGIESLKHECAFYKKEGFKYLYLGIADDYKSQLDGYEILGPL
jgi:hypothetical protein